LLIPRYYDVRGWDKETGFPLEEILNDLGLETIAAELEPYRADYRKKVEKAAISP
jgi:aldehyde:ferredoxin oxidoreductase